MNGAVKANQVRLARIRSATVSRVVGAFDALPDYHSDTADRFASSIVPLVKAGQMLTAKTTAAYVAQRTRTPTARIDPAKVTGAAVRNGADPLDVYRRPFGIMWSALGDGADLTEAKVRGRDRLAMTAAMDVWLAMRAASNEADRQIAHSITWVRVADPGACELCAAAEGSSYSDAGDMAGHPNCGCTIDPVLGEPDVTPADSSAYDIHTSDELGPLLYAAGHSFSGL